MYINLSGVKIDWEKQCTRSVIAFMLGKGGISRLFFLKP